jgi:hypothetical protein
MNLELITPLVYFQTENISLDISENDELLLCFELNLNQSRSIEPDIEQFLGPILYMGIKNAKLDFLNVKKVLLPAGKYLFVQCRSNEGILCQEEWLNLAIEQQKDSLWERHKPGNKLYVRHLFEDENFVTQLFRTLES